MSISPDAIKKQISTLTAELIQNSICNHQQFPAILTGPDGITEVTIEGRKNLSVMLKNIPYAELYSELNNTGTYNIRMIDGALIQFMYRFRKNDILAHRLAFFPCPDLSEYQNNSDIYDTDELYAEVVAKNIVSVPVRFDFDADNTEELHHPSSHLTLGQYSNCRIPVGAPVTPFVFMDFILRSFYNTTHKKICGVLTNFSDKFPATILKMERDVLHIVPGGALPCIFCSAS
jgi:hypothetical protein